MFNFKTLEQLVQMSRAAFRANLKGSDAWVWPNNVYASAKVIGGMIFEAFGFASYVSKAMFAWSAPDLDSLSGHGVEYDIPQNPAAPASGNLIFAVTDNITVNTGAILQRTDGVQYVVSSGGSLATSGTLTLPVMAATNGLNTNLAANAPLQIMSGVSTTSTTQPTCAVDGNGLTLGADLEDIESWRARILFRKRNPPHGGAPADYVQWAGQVAGVSFYLDQPTVYVERLWSGPGTARVFPLMYDLYANGIPSAADVQRVAEYFVTVQPASAGVTVAAPQPVTVDVVISGLTPNTTDVQEAVIAELQDTFRRLSRPCGSDSNFGSMPYLAYNFSFSRSWIWQAIANATGEQRHVLNSPTADVTLNAGQMAVLGNVSFV
jgi:uncharacterized phage protein gp47/JayE